MPIPTLHRRFSPDIWERCCFDPVTLTMASLGATAIGGGVSALGTLAGGSAAKAAGQMQQTEANYQATQLQDNATQAIASGQRQMFDTQQKTRLALSSLTARAAASGVNAGVGSPVAAAGQLVKRGSYNAAMDMFNGQSTATGLENQAAGVTYSGEAAALGGDEAEEASYLTASGTLAGSAGSMFKTYGGYAYPSSFKSA